MCTLSFMPRRTGYLLAMNRDERLTRPLAMPPKMFDLNGRRAIFPYEGSGGTWIGANDRGLTVALLNQNLNRPVTKKKSSRGTVVRRLLRAATAKEVQTAITNLDLAGILPFRVFAFVPRERTIVELDWDGSELRSKTNPWKPGHWFSSGRGDETATRLRGAVCRAAWKQSRSGTLTWLRQLHRSHRPKRGAFSICIHRDDAQSVSYTEVSCSNRSLELRYYPGLPCGRAKPVMSKLPLRPEALATNFSSKAETFR